MNSLQCITRSLASLALKPVYSSSASSLINIQVRNLNIHYVDQPKPADHKSPATTFQNYRFKVHYPEDGKYTIKPLKMTKLAGRDPETGRIIVGTLGGGHKRNYRWIDWYRTGPKENSFYEERVIHIQYDPNRSARIALVGSGTKLRYILATENMKAGDLIKTTCHIPRIPVRPKEGDAHPLGALPMGTQVHCVEAHPGEGGRYIKGAGNKGILMRKIGEKVVVQLPSKREIAFAPECMAVIGRLSNIDHGKQHVGSAQRRRWLGRRPASGLWQRKDGYKGRKIRPLPPVKSLTKPKEKAPLMKFTLCGEGPPRPIVPATNRVS